VPDRNGVVSLEGETALITGGATGLGFGIAHAFATAGAKVILMGRREELLRQACARLGGAAQHITGDVTDHEAAGPIIEALQQRNDFISILVNNAGNHLKKPAAETSEREFQSVLNTHVVGAFAFTRRLIPAMTERRRGSILFLASMASLMGLPLVTAYSAAKSAYLGLVRSLACELGPHGVRVNAIAPGWIETPMLERALQGDPARARRIRERTPLGGFGSPEDIGWAAVYLCSPAARFVTGAVLPVDGGASIGF